MRFHRGPNKGKLLAKISDARRIELEQLGAERALIYKTAVLTGLRLNELRTLSCRDLSFGEFPNIKLSHSNEKNRRGSTLALRSDLAKELREWIECKERGEHVFNVPSGLLRIMDRDLKAAGIPKKDADGCVVHVHALRHSFSTHLSLAGVAPRVAQAAMRHSNIALTMRTYTDTRLLDTHEAIETLPILRTDCDAGDVNAKAAAPAECRANDDQEESPSIDDRPRQLAPMLAPKPGQRGQNGSIPGHLRQNTTSTPETRKPRKTLSFPGFSKVGDTELESVTSTMST